MTQPFPMIEVAIQNFIEANYPAAAGRTGGDPGYTLGDPLFVWISMFPGGGSTDRTSGTWAVDIDVLAPTYREAMEHSLAIEALLVGPQKSTLTMVLDNCYQNTAPSERPWDGESTSRVGATYVFTARRSG